MSPVPASELWNGLRALQVQQEQQVEFMEQMSKRLEKLEKLELEARLGETSSLDELCVTERIPLLSL